MEDFRQFKIKNQLLNALDDLGFVKPTPIQSEAYSKILSGRDIVGISQTGTGKTLAFLLPILQELKFSDQIEPRILILVPTRELVLQIVEQIEQISKYISLRVLGVYGGTNINTQKKAVLEGVDILVATPQRLYDLAISNSLKLKFIKKLIIDEVDIMLDFGYRTQLNNIFTYLPEKKQNIMFSATMTENVDELIDSYFDLPEKISIAVSGTPLDNINQVSYCVQNFTTKSNLVKSLLSDIELFNKVLIFISKQELANILFDELNDVFPSKVGLIHSKKEQNFRNRSIEEFESGKTRILIATDVIARGVDLNKISHVINFDTPYYPENYMHRIGRTGRADEKGEAILLFSEKEREQKESIQRLMNYQIPLKEIPFDVEISNRIIADEIEKKKEVENIDYTHKKSDGGAYHEKSEKNLQKMNSAPKPGKFDKYTKPQRRGDKIQNLKSKKNKKKR